MIFPSEVRQITISCTSPLVRSLMMVATNIIKRSELLSKKSEHIRYPILFRIRFLFWVRFIAWMCAKGVEWPSISMYRALIRCYLICLAVSCFSPSLDLRVESSLRMMRSSYCLDLVYPMLLMSYLRSLERWEAALVIMIINTQNREIQLICIIIAVYLINKEITFNQNTKGNYSILLFFCHVSFLSISLKK